MTLRDALAEAFWATVFHVAAMADHAWHALTHR